MKIGEMLKKCGGFAHTASEELSVSEAAGEMALKKTGILIVFSADGYSGVFTGRDVFRCCRTTQSRPLADIRVSDVMTRDIVASKPEDDLGEALNKMLLHKIRHLPVMDSQKVLGILTIEDLVREQLDLLHAEINFLNDYISRLQEAEQD